jgi:hypothetical protein
MENLRLIVLGNQKAAKYHVMTFEIRLNRSLVSADFVCTLSCMKDNLGLGASVLQGDWFVSRSVGLDAGP